MQEGTKITSTTGGAIGFSALASFIGLCCVGPCAVALFGVSGAITMSRFDFLRPYILVVLRRRVAVALGRCHARGAAMRWSLAMMTLCLSVMVFASDNAPGYVLMNADLAELKSDFNEAADQVRLVFIVGPT